MSFNFYFLVYNSNKLINKKGYGNIIINSKINQ